LQKPLLAPEGSGRTLLQTARWLLLPTLCVVGHWWLLLQPAALLRLTPQLWTPADAAIEDLVPLPQTKRQVFEFGWHAAKYSELCGVDRRDSAECKRILKGVAKLLGATRPLTPSEFLELQQYMIEFDRHPPFANRVLGFFSFVNIMWFVAILGIAATVGPVLLFVLGPVLTPLCGFLIVIVVHPVVSLLHRSGALELAAYLMAMSFSVQGSRYPMSSTAGMMVALTGALAVLPCWAYSTFLHTACSIEKTKFMTLAYLVLAATTIPLAVIHASQLIGFLSVLAVYGALSFVFVAVDSGFLIGFDSKDCTHRCIAASVVLVACFLAMRVAGVNTFYLKPFALGGICLGNVLYFLALLILSSGLRVETGTYIIRQLLMAFSLSVALLLGGVYAMPAMTSTASTFSLLWIMQKQLETHWERYCVFVLFVNFAALLCLSLWLHQHPKFFMAMFNPAGIYI